MLRDIHISLSSRNRNYLAKLKLASAGLRCVLQSNASKVLVEAITFYEGMYGRFFVLVCLGVGCTVWYAFVPGSYNHAPVTHLFDALDLSM